jgi:hypothetical protein
MKKWYVITGILAICLVGGIGFWLGGHFAGQTIPIYNTIDLQIPAGGSESHA